jgi:hypothetical protein
MIENTKQMKFFCRLEFEYQRFIMNVVPGMGLEPTRP